MTTTTTASAHAPMALQIQALHRLNRLRRYGSHRTKVAVRQSGSMTARRSLAFVRMQSEKQQQPTFDRIWRALRRRRIIAIALTADNAVDGRLIGDALRQQCLSRYPNYSLERCGGTIFISRDESSQLTFNEEQVNVGSISGNRICMMDAQGFPFEIHLGRRLTGAEWRQVVCGLYDF